MSAKGMSKARRLNILLVEDNPADVFLLRAAIEAHVSCDFTLIGNGDRAFDFLERRGEYAEAARPDLIVLDLNLPGKDGVEVLDLIRGSAELRDIVVTVVSSSPRDVVQRKAAQADCYFTKPSDLDEFLGVGKKILDCYSFVRGQKSAGR